MNDLFNNTNQLASLIIDFVVRSYTVYEKTGKNKAQGEKYGAIVRELIDTKAGLADTSLGFDTNSFCCYAVIT